MNFSKEEVARLNEEAATIRARFKALGKALRGKPGNADYLRERLKLKNRYAEIQRLLGGARISDEAREVPSTETYNDAGPARTVDLSQLDERPSAFRAPRVPIKEEGGISFIGLLKSGRIVAGLSLLIVLCAVLLLIYSGRLGFFIVPTNSMAPTLRPGDQIVASRIAGYNHGDIVVLVDPTDPDAFLVKRIVGLGGDVLEVRNRMLIRNGALVTEPYIREAMEFKMAPYRVPEDMVFVAGDNRNNSDDSFRWREAMPQSLIRGRVRYIYMPSERRGLVSSAKAETGAEAADLA